MAANASKRSSFACEDTTEPAGFRSYAFILTDAEAQQKFFASFEPLGSDECWEWNAGRVATGYGRLRTKGSVGWTASRIALVLKLGRDLGSRMDCCHSCDNPPCVNPAHLFEGTRSENFLGAARKGRWHNPTKDNPKSAWRAQQTHCQNGHEFTAENVRIYRDSRVCRTCERAASARKRAAKRINERGADVRYRARRTIYSY